MKALGCGFAGKPFTSFSISSPSMDLLSGQSATTRAPGATTTDAQAAAHKHAKDEARTDSQDASQDATSRPATAHVADCDDTAAGGTTARVHVAGDVVITPGDSSDAWKFARLFPSDAHTGALCVEGSELLDVRCRQVPFHILGLHK